MKKVTDFIVKFRYIFLITFVVLAGIGIYLNTKVNINEDIMKYLPESSETKIGKDLMDEEFAKQDTSELNVMFKGLSKEDKNNTLDSLKNVSGVASVDYDDTEKYNKDEYTLYVLHVDDYSDSDKAKEVYDYVNDNYKVKAMSGSIADANKPLLHLWVVFVAIACAMVILIILSESWFEPFLYLISIGIAVFINKGTNIMFDSVSNITNSIVAILQLALSMDYSIMLSNRYKQEKETHKNNIDAMKEALYQSFLSISSSSITTIVGLLALVFMSFTIGKDLGFVLAKGVLLSLVSIFFCLPALLLIFDNVIAKTKKKSPNINLSKLGSFCYKTRYGQSILIVILFVVAFLLKGSINVLYTGSEQDEVGKVFKANNQIAIVYENKYEDIISSYCKELESDEKIDQVLCYSNTINEKLAYDELNKKFKDLGQDTEIDEYLIKLIYYNYYNKENESKMTLDEFISFIKSDIYSNPNFSSSVSSDTKNNLNTLSNFTNVNEINKKRSINDIAHILGMNYEDAESILIYYNSKNINVTMTVKDFVNFMINDVSKDPKYASQIDSKTLSQLKQLQGFTDINKINKEMSVKELSSIFGIDEELINKLFLFYRVSVNSDSKMTLNQFANVALELASQEEYKAMFTEEKINSLKLLATLSDDSLVNTKMNGNEMKNSLSKIGLSLDDSALNLLYILYSGSSTDSKLTLSGFANVALNMASKDEYKNYFSEESIKSLESVVGLSTNADVDMPNNKLYAMFGIGDEMGSQLNYAITGNTTGTYNMSPKMFVNTLLTNETFKSSLSEDKVNSLSKAQYIMSNVTTLYDTNSLAKVMNLDNNVVSVVYGVYDYNNGKISKISVKELINFLDSNKSNKMIASHLTGKEDLLSLATIIVNNTKTLYGVSEVSKITSTDSSIVNKIYGVYDYKTKETKLSPLGLTNLILSNKDNELLAGKLDSSSLNKLVLVNEVMNSTNKGIKYNYSSLAKLMNINSDKMSLLFSLYNSKYLKYNQNISLFNYVDFIIRNVMNNKEYSSKFNNQTRNKLNAISKIMKNSLNGIKYSPSEVFASLEVLSDDLDESLIELVYMYYGSNKNYDDSWKMTIEEFINYINDDILKDERFTDFINSDKRKTINDGKKSIDKAKNLIVSDGYSRIVLNTKYDFESEETFKFIESIEDKVGNKPGIYVVGNSSMAVEMSKTFNDELNRITILTILFIFVVVAFTFRDLIIPFVLVLMIQCAVYVTMSFITITGGNVYFISLLIVQAILMGATIDYAIVYTSYYLESRKKMGVKESIAAAYNGSIHTILSSSSILIIVTLVVANFASAIAAKICETISQGTLCAVILILFILPGVLSACDKIICRKDCYFKEKKIANKNGKKNQ